MVPIIVLAAILGIAVFLTERRKFSNHLERRQQEIDSMLSEMDDEDE